MDYSYSLESGLYNDDIKCFLENSPTLDRYRKKVFLYTAIIQTILLGIWLIIKINLNTFNEDINYIIIQFILCYIAAIILLLIYTKVYVKPRLYRQLTEYLEEECMHEISIENDEILYSYSDNKKINLNNDILKEVVYITNIIGITISKKKSRRNVLSIIIIPKNIFESKESLNEFKNILESKLKKNE